MAAVDHKAWWSADHERNWLASRVSDLQTVEEKVAYVRKYLTSLPLRYMSFNGDGPIDEWEYREVETFCLRLLYQLEDHNK